MLVPSKLLLLSLPQAAASASVSIQCTPVGCVHSLMANALQIGKVSGWLGSVSLKASDHVAEHVAVQHFSKRGCNQMGDAGNERNELMELNGADIVVRCLADEGVEHVFGYPGGAVLYIYDAIYKQDKFQHILVRHEQAAVHAADAYSRSSNKVGVCLVTSGPGVTNAVTGIAPA